MTIKLTCRTSSNPSAFASRTYVLAGHHSGRKYANNVTRKKDIEYHINLPNHIHFYMIGHL